MSQTYIPSDLRRLVVERARSRREYCGIPDSATFIPHEIDHVIAEKHDGPTTAENLSLCCAVCNKRKGSDIGSIDPETGDLVALYHPRRDHWDEHFRLTEDGRIEGKTSVGRVTARFLRFNVPKRVEERRLLLVSRVKNS